MNKKLRRIYTLSLSEYLQEQGFIPQKILPDLRRPEFLNWFFEESEELKAAIAEFSAARKEARRND